MRNKEDWETTKQRFTAWWNGEVIDRAVIQAISPKAGHQPSQWFMEKIKEGKSFSPQQGVKATKWEEWDWWQPINDFDRPDQWFERFKHWCNTTFFGGEAFPSLFINLGPGILSAYLGANPRVIGFTVWFETPTDWPALDKIHFDDSNPWWLKTKELFKLALEISDGEFFVGIPDLGGITDIAAALRGGKELVLDTYREPEKIMDLSEKILTIWHDCYDTLFNLQPKGIGTSAWMQIWSPKEWYPIQCDISALMSPWKFKEIAIPFIREQCQRLDHVIYHFDGPQAIPHLDLLLAIPELHGIQWIPGTGNPDTSSSRWMKMYKKIQKSGKLLVLDKVPFTDVEHILRNLSSKGLLLQTIVDEEEKVKKLLDKAKSYVN